MFSRIDLTNFTRQMKINYVNHFSQDKEIETLKFLFTVINMIILTIGVPANIMTMFTISYTKNLRMSATDHFLFNLSIVDLFNLTWCKLISPQFLFIYREPSSNCHNSIVVDHVIMVKKGFCMKWVVLKEVFLACAKCDNLDHSYLKHALAFPRRSDWRL